MSEEGAHTTPTSGDAPGGVTLRVLGPIEADTAGQAASLGGPQQRGLLGLLLVNAGRSVSTDQLIDELWRGEPPAGAATTIRSYVSRLRRVLGATAPIVGSAAGYSIEVVPERVDSAVFERLVRAADADFRAGQFERASARLTSALALWRGRPFGALADDGLLRIEADRLEELRLHALEQRIEAEIELGRAAELVDEIEALVSRHPYRERLWRLAMLALYHSGRQADALAAYHRARRMLDEQLGLDPNVELQRLEQQVLRHEVAPLRGLERSSRLPPDLTTFIGRETELADIGRSLTASRLVTLTGVGGVGKTRIAIEAARRLEADGAGDAAFVDLAPVGDASGVARVAARVLETREQPGQSVLEAVAADLRRSSMLIVLDNCEHVAEAAAELVELLLRATAGVRVLATSRGPLGLPGEKEIAVTPLAIARPGASGDELRRSDAIRLLLDRMPAHRGRELDDEATLGQAARICRDLDGIPLAIELAAARSKALSLNDIAARLDDRFRFLVSWRRVSSARHQTLKAAMDWSYDLLGQAEQRLFSDLAVFAGGFTVEAAAQVCLGADESMAVDLLGRLVDASLLIAETNRDRVRYRVLETVRQYAATRLAEQGRLSALREAHARYFAALAKRAEPELTGSNQRHWFELLDAELDNLHAALGQLAEIGSHGQGLLEFAVALTRFWYVRGHLAEAREQLQRALRAAGDVAAPLRRRALTAVASVALLQGDYPVATEFAERSLAVARTTGEDRLVANGLSNLGAITLAAGDSKRAGALLTEAVDIARRVGDMRILALALNNLGDHALTEGDYVRAEPLFSESLALLRERGDTANVARSLFNLGAVALRRGRIEDAERLLHEGLATGRSAGDKEDVCWCLLGYAALALARGKIERAVTLLGAASALLVQMGAAFKPFERTLHDDTAAAARLELSSGAFDAAIAHGEQMALDDAAEYAAAG